MKQHKQDNGVEAFKKESAQVEPEIGNIMQAIKTGVVTACTKEALQEAEERKTHIEEAILSAQQFSKTEWQKTLDQLVDEYKRLVMKLENIPKDKIARIRTAIKSLVGGEIRLKPNKNNLIAEVQGDYAGLPSLSGMPKNKLNLVVYALHRNEYSK